jgi:heterodisulfide reductase subunit A-like polyferredoxin
MELEADMVVLSCALEPSTGTVQAAKALSIGLTPELFVREKHPKLDPASTTSRGVFVCGTAAGAKDITDSILQARAAASKAVRQPSRSDSDIQLPLATFPLGPDTLQVQRIYGNPHTKAETLRRACPVCHPADLTAVMSSR